MTGTLKPHLAHQLDCDSAEMQSSIDLLSHWLIIDCMRFEWAPEKDRANVKKHGFSFAEATTLFTGGKEYLEIYDEEHSEAEDRFIAIGPSAKGIIVVVYTERSEDLIRIISARLASRKEIRLFQERDKRDRS